MDHAHFLHTPAASPRTGAQRPPAVGPPRVAAHLITNGLIPQSTNGRALEERRTLLAPRNNARTRRCSVGRLGGQERSTWRCLWTATEPTSYKSSARSAAARRHRQDRDGPLRPRHDRPRHPAYLVEIYDIEVFPDLISKITDAVVEEVKQWPARPRNRPIWPVIFLDAIVCKVRDAGTVKNKGAHLAVASTWTARRKCWGSGSSTPRAPGSGCG